MSEGQVVGILGPWGSGKTSFINLVMNHLQESPGFIVLEFNPWMFSGAEQLVQSFFIELAAQLHIRSGKFEDVSNQLAKYGEVLAPIRLLPGVGVWFERFRTLNTAIKKFYEQRKKGINSVRDSLREKLAALENPIVVVIDDIDRLDTNEIRDMFKLVRLTASFPNMIYLLAFDRKRVEDALSEQGINGRDYLEKILQVAVDIPVVPSDLLNRQILQAIDLGLNDIQNPGPFDSQIWPDIFMEIIRPLIRNMRDVRRYVAAAHGTVSALAGQIALPDVLALEAIRIFLPDVFTEMTGMAEALTKTSSISYHHHEPPELKEAVERLVELGNERNEVVRHLIERIFPAAQRHIGGSHYGGEFIQVWLRERRLANVDFLRLYFERVAGTGIQAFNNAEHAFSILDDDQLLDGFLRGLDPLTLQDTITALEAFEKEYTQEAIVPAVTVLMNLLPDIPERPRGLFDLDTRLVVGRVVLRLLRRLEEPAQVEEAVKEVLPKISTYSSKLDLIRTIGYVEGVGHKMVSEEAAKGFAEELRQQVINAPAEVFTEEWDLLRLILWVRSSCAGEESRFVIPNDPSLTVALLNSAKSETRSQSMGSRAVNREGRLYWDGLIEVFGTEEILGQRIYSAKIAANNEHKEVFELADKYLSGWRPDRNDF